MPTKITPKPFPVQSRKFYSLHLPKLNSSPPKIHDDWKKTFAPFLLYSKKGIYNFFSWGYIYVLYIYISLNIPEVFGVFRNATPNVSGKFHGRHSPTPLPRRPSATSLDQLAPQRDDPYAPDVIGLFVDHRALAAPRDPQRFFFFWMLILEVCVCVCFPQPVRLRVVNC